MVNSHGLEGEIFRNSPVVPWSIILIDLSVAVRMFTSPLHPIFIIRNTPPRQCQLLLTLYEYNWSVDFPHITALVSTISIWCARSSVKLLSYWYQEAFRSPGTTPEFRNFGVVLTTRKRVNPNTVIDQERVLLPEYVPSLERHDIELRLAYFKLNPETPRSIKMQTRTLQKPHSKPNEISYILNATSSTTRRLQLFLRMTNA